MEFFEIIDNIKFIWGILGFGIGLASKITVQAWKRFRLRTVLSLKRDKKKCVVSIPEFKAKVLNVERNVMVVDEVQQLLDISVKLGDMGILVVPMANREQSYDEIHIGGPSTNINVNKYFNMYLQNIKWRAKKERVERYKSSNNRETFDFSYIEIDDQLKEGFAIGEGDSKKLYEYIPAKKGWAIILKKKITRDISTKTVHLLFGCGTNGTVGAVEYFLNNYTEIYRIYRDKEYFGIFQVNGDGEKVGDIIWLDVDTYFK